MGSVVKTIKSASALPAEGFENYLSETSKISVPFTQIQNRAKIINLAADGGVRFGINRIMTQQIKKAQGEFGPNGENVFKVSGDKFDQIRFVGNWVNNNNLYGQDIGPTGNVISDYAEITFYGTGLNVLALVYPVIRNFTAQVDGGSVSAPISATSSDILGGRNYNKNTIIPLVSGLSLGIHTVKIGYSGGGCEVMGFETLNESAQLDVRPNTAYIKGEAVSIAQQSIDFNSNFTNVLGSAGTKGGRVLVYSDNQGVVKKDIQYVDTTPQYLALADHSNEEIVRTINWKEFGAGRSNDFSALSSVSDRAFTLDDGITTLVGSSVKSDDSNIGLGYLQLTSGGGFSTLTFVGTGLNLQYYVEVSGFDRDIEEVWIDGVNVGGITGFNPTTNNMSGTVEIVSGLPYGTHTVKLVNSLGPHHSFGINSFTIYQPKTPILPANSIELSMYNIMADYIPPALGGVAEVGTGSLRKAGVREFIYVDGTGGTVNWQFNGGDSPLPNNSNIGFELSTDRLNAYMEYTFFGTGFMFAMDSGPNVSSDIRVTLNGLSAITSNFSTLQASANGTGVTYDIVTNGSFDFNDATTERDNNISLYNLPLGLYTVRLTNNNSGNYIQSQGLDIITPIHSVKQNNPTIQNAIEVGSQAISDSRNFKSYNIDDEPNWVQARATSGSITTTATSEIPMPGMIAHIKTNGKPIEIDFLHVEHGDTNGMFPTIYLYLDGKEVQNNQHRTVSAGADIKSQVLKMVVPISAGFHTVQIFWATPAGGGTLTSYSSTRTLTVKELK